MADLHTYKASAEQIMSGSPMWEHVVYVDNYGIGLDTDPDTDKKYHTGYVRTPIIDCGPNVTEYGQLTYDMDIYYGGSGVNWEVRSSVDRVSWSSWYTSTSTVPVRQYIQFKFTLMIVDETGI
jgi:hypothetical protein